jgi:fumarate reductase subunit C
MVESSQNKRYVKRVQDGWWLEEKVYIYIYMVG